MTYDLQTERFGTIQLEAESIEAARKRARSMFGKDAVSVSRQQAYTCCSSCDSRLATLYL